MNDGSILRTTVVGSYPKPIWLSNPYGILFGGWRLREEVLREGQDDATVLAVRDQERAGIDLVSDGEQRRENFVFYFTRRFEGFDFARPARRVFLGTNREFDAPRIVGPVARKRPVATSDVRFLKAQTARPVKMAIPGPMTIIDTSHDEHYRGDLAALAFDLADAINAELRDWVHEGCDVVQIDEPAFTRYPERVQAFGLAALERCLAGITVRRVVHVCHGYPIDGSKVRKHGYEEILPALADSSLDALSLECAAPELAPSVVDLCGGKDVLFGVVDIGRNEVEHPVDVAARIHAASKRIAPERLWVAPDCGLVLLDRSLARAKLAAMVEGARLARAELLGIPAKETGGPSPVPR